MHQWLLSLSREAADEAPVCEAAPSQAELTSVLLQTQHFREKRETFNSRSSGTESFRESNDEHGQVPASLVGSGAVRLQPWHGQRSSIAQGPPILAPPGWKPHHIHEATGHPLLALQSPRVHGPTLLSHRGWLQLPDVSMLQTTQGGKPQGDTKHTPIKAQRKLDVPKRPMTQMSLRRSGRPSAFGKNSSKSERRLLSSKPTGHKTKDHLKLSNMNSTALALEKTQTGKKIAGKAQKRHEMVLLQSKPLRSKPLRSSRAPDSGAGAAEEERRGKRQGSEQLKRGHAFTLKHSEKKHSDKQSKASHSDKKHSDKQSKMRHGKAKHGKAKKRSFNEVMAERLSVVTQILSLMVIPISGCLLVTGCLMVFAIDTEES